MEREFIPYEQALALKELGFNEPCFAIWSGFDEVNFSITDTIRLFSSKFNINGTQSSVSYINPTDNRVSAPLYQQAFRWFREKYKIHSSVFWVEIEGFIYWNYRYSYLNGRQVESVNRSITFFDTPEEAKLECLKKLIEIIKNK
jgi:hypothetical protein